MPCWYFDKDELLQSASLDAGITTETETKYRKDGAGFIVEISNQLKLSYEIYETAIVYFHRFYTVYSFHNFQRHVTATTCLFLSCKMHESSVTLQAVLSSVKDLLSEKCFDVFGSNPKESIAVTEQFVLRALKFDLQIDHSYTHLLKMIKLLKADSSTVQQLVYMVWTFINDALYTTLCIQYEPEILAVSFLYLACRLTKFPVVDWHGKNLGSQKKWYEEMVGEVTVDIIKDICYQILDLYSNKESKPEKKDIRKRTRSDSPSEHKIFAYEGNDNSGPRVAERHRDSRERFPSLGRDSRSRSRQADPDPRFHLRGAEPDPWSHSRRDDPDLRSHSRRDEMEMRSRSREDSESRSRSHRDDPDMRSHSRRDDPIRSAYPERGSPKPRRDQSPDRNPDPVRRASSPIPGPPLPRKCRLLSKQGFEAIQSLVRAKTMQHQAPPIPSGPPLAPRLPPPPPVRYWNPPPAPAGHQYLPPPDMHRYPLAPPGHMLVAVRYQGPPGAIPAGPQVQPPGYYVPTHPGMAPYGAPPPHANMPPGQQLNMPYQGPHQGPPQGPPQGPHQGPPQGPHQGPPQGPHQGPPQGPHQGPPQGPPLGPHQGPPQGPHQGPLQGQPQGPFQGQPPQDSFGRPDGPQQYSYVKPGLDRPHTVTHII